jgi:uncharacterized protein (TIGR02265 family)
VSDGKIKGSIMIEVVKFLRSRKEDARAVVPSHLHHYLNTRILATSWHPEQDYLELMRAVVKLRPAPRERGVSPFEDASRDTTEAFFEGPYKALIRSGDPGRSLNSLGALWRLRHDTGEFEVELTGAKSARAVLRDYVLLHREACELVQGTLWGLLHHSGGKDIDIEHTRCRSRGHDACEWRLSWV